jgi:type IV pilus assembly protein PilQ
MTTRAPFRLLIAALLAMPMASATGQAARSTPISVNFIDASWPEVASLFASSSGRSIIVGPGVTGTVNATIRNQPWEYVFNAVLASHGYSVAEMPGGILRIDSPGELAKLDSVEVLQSQMIRLNYAKAPSVALTIVGMLTPGRGKVVADSSLNALVITETRTRLPQIIEFVNGMDIRTPTVAIEAKLIFVDRTDLQQLGFKYDLGTGQQFFNRLIQRIDPLTGQPYNPNTQVVNLGGNAMSAISNADQLISGSALDLAFTTAIGGFSLTAFLSALERVELTDVEAVPIIHTLDNQEAYILSGEETPVRVIDAASFGQANQAPRANVQFKETGIKLTVTPSVTANREIQMQIEAERSSIQPLAAADLGFTIPKQIASTRLLVRDGESAVIGGLTTTTVTRNRAGIPLLSSLPFVGSLFSYSENRENRKDLIVMVTPRIVDDPMP